MLLSTCVTVLAWAQEPWFLRSAGIQILWHGSGAINLCCFLLGTVSWLHQARERICWGRCGLAGSWTVSSGLALTLYCLAFSVYGIVVSLTLEWISGYPGLSVLAIVSHGLGWVLLAAPVAFLAPGLAFSPWSTTSNTCAASLLLAIAATFLTPASLDPVPVSANLLLAGLLATMGSSLLSASLRRAFSN